MWDIPHRLRKYPNLVGENAQGASYPGSLGIPACRSKPIQVESTPPPTPCKQGCPRTREFLRLRANGHVFFCGAERNGSLADRSFRRPLLTAALSFSLLPLAGIYHPRWRVIRPPPRICL